MAALLPPVEAFPKQVKSGMAPFCGGIDEAGRGPVLGPLVYSIAFCPLHEEANIKQLGVQDSKTLSADQRNNFIKSLTSARASAEFGWLIKPISAVEISQAMLKKNKINLNTLSHLAIVELIERVLSKGINITTLWIDTVGVPASLERFLSSKFPKIKFTVSPKADSLYPMVSAASILAKVFRDVCLENWDFASNAKTDRFQNKKFGSGYPGDPVTIGWLNNNIQPFFGFADLIRFSWSTCEKILQEHAIEIEWPVPTISELGSSVECRTVEVKKAKMHKQADAIPSCGQRKLSSFFKGPKSGESTGPFQGCLAKATPLAALNAHNRMADNGTDLLNTRVTLNLGLKPSNTLINRR
ncbi:Ribonuclease H2 subunit A [Mitosporidium daphniae]